MTERILVELQKEAIRKFMGCDTALPLVDFIADHMIANGVTLLPETGIGDMSDGYHTFNELYHHRAILFSVICKMLPDKAWKAKKHHDGTMYDGMFIVGIDTPEGQATYHYDLEPYWDVFHVKELEVAPVWDGHSPDDAISRIGNLDASVQKHGQWTEYVSNDEVAYVCGNCRCIESKATPFCPHCGAKMELEDE